MNFRQLVAHFVGRISKEIPLSELSLADCRKFWGKAADRVSDVEVLNMLSVTGGVPKYLEEMDPALSVEENVRLLCFSPGGYLFRDFEVIFSDVFESDTSAKLKIVEALAEGPASLSELVEKAGLELNGHVSSDLKELCAAGFVASSEGLNPTTGNPELGWIEDGRHFVSKTRPTHASGQVMLDGGIVWGFVQSNALHTCGVRNVMFRDIYLHQPRTAFSVHYDIGKFSRSYYPGAEISWQENLFFDNIRLLHDAKLPFLSVSAPVRNIRFSENCTPAPGSVVTNALAASLMNGR